MFDIDKVFGLVYEVFNTLFALSCSSIRCDQKGTPQKASWPLSNFPSVKQHIVQIHIYQAQDLLPRSTPVQAPAGKS